MEDGNHNFKKASLPMILMAVICFSIGLISMFEVAIIYHLSPLTSISEGATTGNKAGEILPFSLGFIACYCLGYVGYCKSEKIIVKISAAGFSLVALQPTNSSYVTESKVGFFGLSPQWSSILHLIGAIIGFGAMFVWIAFFFTRTNEEKIVTPQKIIRNRLYMICSGMMMSGILLFLIGSFGVMGKYSTFIGEEFMLIPTGFALFLKDGYLLKDKEET